MAHDVTPERGFSKSDAPLLEILLPECVGNVGAFRIRQVDCPSLSALVEHFPGLHVNEGVQFAWIDGRLTAKMLALQPGVGLVAVWGIGDAAPFTVNEQIVASAQGELFHPGNPFPSSGRLRPWAPPDYRGNLL